MFSFISRWVIMQRWKSLKCVSKISTNSKCLPKTESSSLASVHHSNQLPRKQQSSKHKAPPKSVSQESQSICHSRHKARFKPSANQSAAVAAVGAAPWLPPLRSVTMVLSTYLFCVFLFCLQVRTDGRCISVRISRRDPHFDWEIFSGLLRNRSIIPIRFGAVWLGSAEK